MSSTGNPNVQVIDLTEDDVQILDDDDVQILEEPAPVVKKEEPKVKLEKPDAAPVVKQEEPKVKLEKPDAAPVVKQEEPKVNEEVEPPQKKAKKQPETREDLLAQRLGGAGSAIGFDQPAAIPVNKAPYNGPAIPAVCMGESSAPNTAGIVVSNKEEESDEDGEKGVTTTFNEVFPVYEPYIHALYERARELSRRGELPDTGKAYVIANHLMKGCQSVRLGVDKRQVNRTCPGGDQMVRNAIAKAAGCQKYAKQVKAVMKDAKDNGEEMVTATWVEDMIKFLKEGDTKTFPRCKVHPSLRTRRAPKQNGQMPGSGAHKNQAPNKEKETEDAGDATESDSDNDMDEA